MDHREILRHYGIRAQKSLGQNFLVNDEILETIADSIDITDRDILEIGPGYGALTEKILARKPKSLTLIELDKQMVNILNSRIHEKDLVIPEETEFTIIEGDVLKYVPDFSSRDTPRRISTNYSVIANIPYYITSPILFRFLHELENKPEEMVILMQKEVGDKICRKK
jgi:16S rRNA (adenine1518-N6/adenine1519-N6)-dimethyltransferase